MSRILLTVFLFVASLHVFAQEYFIDWGPDNKRSAHQVLDVLPDKGANFYSFHVSNSQFLQVPKVTRYDNGVPAITKKIEQHIEDNMVSLEELVVFNGTLIGFLSDKKDGMNSLYMVKYDTEIDPYGKPVMINSFPISKAFSPKGDFNVLVSKSKKFLCVEYIIPGKRDLFDRFGYKVLDTTFKVITEGEYEIPYSSRSASVDTRYLTDHGDYILGISVYSNANIGLWKDYNALEKTIVVHVKGDQFSEYELKIEGKRIFDIGVSSLDSILIVTGTYGESNASGSQGVFMQRINLDDQKIANEWFHLFPREFMTQEMTPNQIDRLEKREIKGRLGPQLYNYAIRSIHQLEEASTIVVAEQYYVYQQNSSDMRGISQTMYHYYYNDIVMYKIDSIGTFNWITRIQKEQHSVNDYGYYSSIKTVMDNGKLFCFFNDNRQNYDEFRNYEGFNRSINFPTRKKSYALALGKVDVETGSVERSVFNDYNETGGYVVLKLSSIDHLNKQLIFFSQGRRDRFGLLQY